MAAAELTTGSRTIKTDSRNVVIEEALLYIAEINDELARATGLDLMSVSAAAIDSVAAVTIVKRLGLSGRAYIKHVNGKAYVILKGNPKSRPVLKGTRYLKTNPKVAKLVLGAKDLARGAAKMTGIAVVAFAALRVVEHVFSENDPRLTQLVGTIASDVVKFGFAAGAGFLTGAAVAAVTTVAAGPIIAAIVVGVGVSIFLDRVDRKYGLTETLVRAIEDTADKFQSPFRKLSRYIAAWERYFVSEALRRQMLYR